MIPSRSDRDAQRARISQLSTNWSEIFAANHRVNDESESTESTSQAQRAVLEKYGPCVLRYLLGATQNSDAAEELAQEFAFRFVRGDLCGANPDKGRFRDYLRVVLRNLVNDHFRRNRQSVDLSRHIQEQNVDPFEELDREFHSQWRNQVLDSTWSSLKQEQGEKGNHFHTVLEFRARNAKLSSQQMSAQLSEILSKKVTADWVRQTIHRARQRFATLLLSEVKKTIQPQDDVDQLREELADLQLLELIQDLHPSLATGTKSSG